MLHLVNEDIVSYYAKRISIKRYEDMDNEIAFVVEDFRKTLLHTEINDYALNYERYDSLTCVEANDEDCGIVGFDTCLKFLLEQSEIMKKQELYQRNYEQVSWRDLKNDLSLKIGRINLKI